MIQEISMLTTNVPVEDLEECLLANETVELLRKIADLKSSIILEKLKS
jgi:hypothetical protein